MARKTGRDQAFESAMALLREHHDEVFVIRCYKGSTNMTEIVMNSHTASRVGGLIGGWIEGSKCGELYDSLGGGMAELDAHLRSSADTTDLIGGGKPDEEDE